MKIKNVELDLAGKTIKLSVKQARELRDILNETFPDNESVREIVYRDRYWRPCWNYSTPTVTYGPEISYNGDKWNGRVENSGTLQLSTSSLDELNGQTSFEVLDEKIAKITT